MNKLYRCQVFTPIEKVNKLLDSVEYKCNLLGKKFLENSCGNGSILCVAIERYIKDCISNNISPCLIKKGLEDDFWGFEIDNKKHAECISNLNNLIKKYNLSDVKWKIFQKDFLKIKLNQSFSYIIGNPPYINYRDLSIDTRKYLKNHFLTCSKGKFDYCYAFIEKSIDYLDTKGKMAYLIPSSIFKNVFADKLRTKIMPDVVQIIDFKTERVFQDALVATSILICEKNTKVEHISYYNAEKKIKRKIKRSNLNGKWVFDTDITSAEDKRLTRFGDLFNASISVATLFNKAFILDCNSDQQNIEQDVLKPAKSPRNLAYSKKENIIFPYYYKNNKLEKYSEQDFVSKFPNAMKYLKKFKEELDNRNKDFSAKWFEYGRSQALAHLNQEKLLISTVVTDSIKVYNLTPNDIPYAGIYITSKNGTSLNEARKILSSNAFLDYVFNIGIQASGTSLRITAKDVNNFKFDMEAII